MQQYAEYDRLQRMRHVAKVDENIWFGSATSLNPKTIAELCIDEVFHFVPLSAADKVSGVVYNELILEDNSQSAKEMMAIAENIYPLLSKLNAEGKRTLVCCSQGKSRSAAIMAYYLMNAHGLSFEVANERLLAVRKCININPGFKNALLSLEIKKN